MAQTEQPVAVEPGQVWRHLRGFPVTVEELTPRNDACWIRYKNGGLQMLWLSELRARYTLEPRNLASS